jgi:hypothetical protein
MEIYSNEQFMNINILMIILCKYSFIESSHLKEIESSMSVDKFRYILLSTVKPLLVITLLSERF